MPDIRRYLATASNRWYVLAAAFVIALHLTVAMLGIYLAPLGFDESYVAQAPWNLVQGNGYATFDCCNLGEVRPFDALISTGPAVLLPIALSFLVFGVGIIQLRWMMVPFYALLVVTAWVFGRKIGGRWVGLVSAVSLLALNLRYDFPQTVIWSVTDGLGELPAAAFMLLAVILLPRSRWGAGLALGIAAICKLVAVLAVPAFVVAILLLPAAGISKRLKLKSIAVFGVLVAAPSVAWELVKVISLGPAGYVGAFRDYASFVMGSGSGITKQSSLGEFGSRAINMAEVWFLPWQLGVLVLVALVGLGVIGYRVIRSRSAEPQRTSVRIWAIASVGTIVTFLGWWVVISSSFFTRHAFPGLLLLPPVFAAFAAVGLAWLMRHQSKKLAAVGVLLAIAWVGVAAWQTANNLVQSTTAPTYTRADQVAVASLVRADYPEGVQHVGYWFNPELQLLSEVESLPFPTGVGPLVLSPQMEGIAPDLYAKAKDVCGEIVYERDGFVVCAVETTGAEPITVDQ